MSKKLSWLDKFAEEQASKMEKTASLEKKAEEQIIVDFDEIPDAETGASVNYKGASYKVVDANYNDEIGAGIILEKEAALEDEKVEDVVPAEKCEVCDNESCTCEKVEEALEAPVVEKKVTDAPEMARTNPGDIYDIEVRDTVEVQKFEGEAAETASNIAAENAIDGTTPEGKVNRILQRIKATPVVPAIEEAPVVEEVKEEVLAVEEVKEETIVEEIPADGEEIMANRIFKRMISAIKK